MASTRIANRSSPSTEKCGGVSVTATAKGRLDMKQTQSTQENDLLSLMSLNEKNESVSLPYNGTSGWSGTDTSEERANENDRNGTTAKTQEFVINHLIIMGTAGGTWKEIAEITGWHHGTVSGALSVLHKDGKIARLTERRNRCRVYVHPAYVNERDTDSQGRKPKECPNCGYHL